MRREKISIPVGNKESVSGLVSMPDTFTPGRDRGFILAHGAGNDMNNPFLGTVADGLASQGILTLRFNFLYKEAGRKAPDPPAKLEMVWLAACDRIMNDPKFSPKELAAGGKSMGGRIASQLAARGRLPADGLIFYGYPLHPAGRPEKLRDDHLYRISIPMLFFSGTRDPLCRLDVLNRVLSQISSVWTLEVVEGGDHSFRILKSSGLDQSRIDDGIVQKTLAWLRS